MQKKMNKVAGHSNFITFFLHIFLFCLHWSFYKIFCLWADHLLFWWNHQNQVRILSHSFSTTKFMRLLKKSIANQSVFEMLCAIWNHLYNLQNSIHRGVILFLLKPAFLLKVSLLHGCFPPFLTYKMIPNCAKHQ